MWDVADRYQRALKATDVQVTVQYSNSDNIENNKISYPHEKYLQTTRKNTLNCNCT
jgi:hypothetical protein